MEESKLLKLTIKPKENACNVIDFHGEKIPQTLRSSSYNVQIDNWTLDRGVSDFTLEMIADEKPKITITAYPDVLDIDVMALVGLNILQVESDSD